MSFFSRFLLSLLLLCSALARADAAFLARPDVQRYIDEQVAAGVLTRPELEAVFANVVPQPGIITVMDRPATSRPWYQFRSNFYNERLISEGVAFWQANEASLTRAAQQYRVPAEMMVAIIGIETRYGSNVGGFRLADVLSTLAFDYPRRAAFFRDELSELLLLSHTENINVLSLRGSYAGAMGLPQFMPSSFRQWAVDFDGDGHRDIWSNRSDAIASVGNYFQQHGWQGGDDVVVPVEVTPGPALDALLADKFNLHYRVSELMAMGVKPQAPVNERSQAVLFSLEVAPGDTRYWLGLNNFYAITRYNKSTLYAMVAHQLSQEIRSRYLQARVTPAP